MFSTTRAISQAALATLDLAGYRAAECDRARHDYTQVVRHRIMNPLTVIEGAAITLTAGSDIAPEVREQLFDVIFEAAARLKTATLEPEMRGSEERELDAVPRF